MVPENNQRSERTGSGRTILHIIAAIVFLPIIWIGVTVNFLDIADRLSFIPGISDDGGILSGITALMITLAVLGIAISGVIVISSGGDLPFVGDNNSTVPTTPTKSPTETSSNVATSTPASTSTKTPQLSVRERDLQKFKHDLTDRISHTMQNESLTGVPVLSTEYRQSGSDKLELWVVFWECDEVEPLQEQRRNIAASFVGTVGTFEGSEPDKLRVYGVTNLKNYNDTATYMNTSEAEATYFRELNPETFEKRWRQRQRPPNVSESEIAYRMVVEEAGEQRADEAFHQHHKEVNGCPGGASDGSGENDRVESIERPYDLLSTEPVRIAG